MHLIQLKHYTRRNAVSESNEDKLSEKIIDAIWNKDFEAFKEYFAQGISVEVKI